MHIGEKRFSVRVIRYREQCKYGDRAFTDYFTFRSGGQAKLTGKVKPDGDFSGSYRSNAGQVSGPYNSASSVRPNECRGSHKFRATLAG